MIWHDRKLVFIHIPKCGGTSIRKAIQKKVGGTHRNRTWLHGWKVLDGDIWNQHATYDQYSLTVPKDYMYIAQVRNPFDRFESMWKHLVRAGFVHSSFNDWGLSAISSLQEGDWEACFEHKPPLRPAAALLFKPQWQWVREDVIIFKMEDKNIWNLLGLKETHLNTSPGKCEWSAKLFRKVQQFYERDFEEFRY